MTGLFSDQDRQAMADRERVIAVVGCGKSKRKEAAAARELYTGALFQKSLALAERLAGTVLILSAKYGLVDPDTTIEPYDLSIQNLTKQQKALWVGGIEMDFVWTRKLLSAGPRTILWFVGENYLGPISDSTLMGRLTGWHQWRFPPLEIGHRLRALTLELEVRNG